MAVPIGRVETRILSIRGHRVMVDTDLAEVYGVPTKRLNEQVKRNAERFPEDFAFRLTPEEKMKLVAKCDRFSRLKHSTAFPLVFTEHGAIMAANVLNSQRAIEAGREIVREIPKGRVLKIKLEVDADPPAGFATQTRYLLQPIPFAVRVYVLPDLFAGKMHALLCRRWKKRVKGRDWYDLVWYAANHPELDLAHLEMRMRQSGHWKGKDSLSADAFRFAIGVAIDALDVEKARSEVAPFVKDQAALALWSREFFRDVAGRIRFPASPPRNRDVPANSR